MLVDSTCRNENVVKEPSPNSQVEEVSHETLFSLYGLYFITHTS